jgi:hypothetical protein
VILRDPHDLRARDIADSGCGDARVADCLLNRSRSSDACGAIIIRTARRFDLDRTNGRYNAILRRLAKAAGGRTRPRVRQGKTEFRTEQERCKPGKAGIASYLAQYLFPRHHFGALSA